MQSSLARSTSLGSGPLVKRLAGLHKRLPRGCNGLRHVKVHGLIAFAIRAMLHEAGVATFDLDAASSFLLDMLNVGASMTNHLCSEIEAWYGLQIDSNPLFGPLAPSKFVTLDRIGFAPSEAPLIHQIG